jgi:hypothetical protein
MMCRIDLVAVATLALIALILSMAYINGERDGQLVNTRSAMVRIQSCRSKTQQSPAKPKTQVPSHVLSFALHRVIPGLATCARD